MKTNAAQLLAISKRGRQSKRKWRPTGKRNKKREQDHVAAVSILKTQGYAAYLRTDHWRQLRKRKLKQVNRCEFCGRDWNLQVHHHTYKRIGREYSTDLVVLCEDCHEEVHDYHRANRQMTLTQATEAVGQSKRKSFKLKDY